MSKAFGRHHDDFPLDQLEPLVLADDAGFDHAADVIDGECPAGETFASCGDGYVHGSVCIVINQLVWSRGKSRTAFSRSMLRTSASGRPRPSRASALATSALVPPGGKSVPKMT